MLLPPLRLFNPGLKVLFLAAFGLIVLLPFALQAQDDTGGDSLSSKLIEPIPAQTDAGSLKIIEYHLKALGGLEALEAIHAVRYTCHVRRAQVEEDLVLTEMGNPFRFHVKTTRKIKGKAFDTFKGYNGEILWSYDPNEKHAFPETHGGQELKDVQNEIFLDPCLNWEANGYTFEYLGEVKSKGKKHYLLKMYFPSGRTAFLYFEAKTLMLTRTGMEVVFGGTIVSQDVYNTSFEKIRGVWFPIEQEYYIDKQKLGGTQISLIEITPEIEPGLFDMPKVREHWLRQQ